MKTDIKKASVQTGLSILVMVLGFLLLVFMIITEDEPGGIPLLLIVTGAIWFLVTRYRLRSQTRIE